MDTFACCLAISHLEEGLRLSHAFQGHRGEPQLAREAEEEGNGPWQGEGHENRSDQGTCNKAPLRGHIYIYDINIYSEQDQRSQKLTLPPSGIKRIQVMLAFLMNK